MLKRHAVGSALTLVGVLLAAAPAAWAHDQGGHDQHGRTLWASPNGGAGPCKQWAPCSLPNAVSAAAAGDKVVALPGVYQGGIVLDNSIDLRGGDSRRHRAGRSVDPGRDAGDDRTAG